MLVFQSPLVGAFISPAFARDIRLDTGEVLFQSPLVGDV